MECFNSNPLKLFHTSSESEKMLVCKYFLIEQLNEDGIFCFGDTKEENETVTSKFSDLVLMNRKSFSGLRKLQYLNDEVINFYGLLLKQCDKSNQNHYFSTQFYSSLRFKGRFDLNATLPFLNKVNVFKKKRIFFPIHVFPNHWALVVVSFVTRSISYYDSLYRPLAGEIINHDILQWLLFAAFEWKQVINFNDWTLNEGAPGIPQQTNGFDCGVFVIMFMDFLSRNKSISLIDDSQTTEYRFAIGLGIINGDLKLIHDEIK
jgi:sentrin-specific protease 1